MVHPKQQNESLKNNSRSIPRRIVNTLEGLQEIPPAPSVGGGIPQPVTEPDDDLFFLTLLQQTENVGQALPAPMLGAHIAQVTQDIFNSSESSVNYSPMVPTVDGPPQMPTAPEAANGGQALPPPMLGAYTAQVTVQDIFDDSESCVNYSPMVSTVDGHPQIPSAPHTLILIPPIEDDGQFLLPPPRVQVPHNITTEAGQQDSSTNLTTTFLNEANLMLIGEAEPNQSIMAWLQGVSS